nr:hypothetical protein [Tanacetum cinerariifolium]
MLDLGGCSSLLEFIFNNLVVPMFQQGEDLIKCINKAMEFLSAIASRNGGIATISKGNVTAGPPRVVKCYNCQGEGHMILDEEQLAFLADPDYDDLSSAKAVLMENLPSGDPEVLSEEIDTLKETLSNNVKEKESLSKTLTVFKTKSKEKESKYIDKEIVLEKQNKELENIISLGYQNTFRLKKAQRIQPTLNDGSAIAKEHAMISVIDDEETLVLEEDGQSKMLNKQNDPISIEKIN